MDAAAFQPAQVLGNAVQYQQLLASKAQQQQQQNAANAAQQHDAASSTADTQQQLHQLLCASGLDPASISPEVWAAACLLGSADKGLALLALYRQLEDCREGAVAQMSLNSSIKALTTNTSTQQQHHHHHSKHKQQHGAGYTNSSSSRGGCVGGSGLSSSSSSSSSVSCRSGGVVGVGQLLSKPTVMDAIKQTHDGRVMAAWEAQQAAWQVQAAHLSALTTKDPGQLTLNTAADEWRSKQELLSALEVAVPAAAAAVHKPNRRSPLDTNNRDGHDGDRGSIQDGGAVGSVACAGGNWMSTLRNANERFVQIGNIFSGLYLSVRNTSTVAAAGLTAIRRPGEEAFVTHVPGADTYMHNSSSSSSCDAGLLSDTTSSAATSAASTHLSSKHHHQLQHQQQAALRRRSTADIAAHTAAAAAAAAAVASHTTIGSSKGSSTAAHTTTNMSLKLGSTSQLCKWSQEAYLQDKLRAGAAAVKVLQTHTPDASQLAVAGWSIPAALASSPFTHTPVSLGDVERRLAVADPSLWQELKAAQQRESSKAAAAAAASAAAAKRAAARAASTQLPHPGPHLEPSHSSLYMTHTLSLSHNQTNSKSNDGGCYNSSISGSTTELMTPVARPSWAVISSGAGGEGGGESAAVGRVAKLCLVNTGTTAVYYSWVNQGRQRLPLAAAAAADTDSGSSSSGGGRGGGGGGSGGDVTAAAAADMHTSATAATTAPYLFSMPDLRGVILPGESRTFRFSFSAPGPGVFHEGWCCFTHPPLEPCPPTRRARGEPITVELKGVAVLDADSGCGPTLLAAEQLRHKLAAKTRDTQVSTALTTILNRVQQQVVAAAEPAATAAPKAAGGGVSVSASAGVEEGCGYDAAVAARWAAANPPGSCGCCDDSSSGDSNNTASQQQQDSSSSVHDDQQQQQQGQHLAGVCVHYYSPGVHGSLCEVYSRARALLQPPAPVVETAPTTKKGGGANNAAATRTAAATKATPAVDHHAHEPLLPETWDCSISGLRALLVRLQHTPTATTTSSTMPQQQGATATTQQQQQKQQEQLAQPANTATSTNNTSNRQAAAVLTQQLCVALMRAGVPSSRRQMEEAACRHMLLQLADSVESAAAAAAAAAAASSVGSESSSISSNGGGNKTHRNTGGGAITSRNSKAGGGGKGGGGVSHVQPDGGGSGAALLQQQQQQQQMLHDDVWSECHAGLSGFEGLLGQYEAAAAGAVDAQAAAYVAAVQASQQQSQAQAEGGGGVGGGGAAAAAAAAEACAWEMFAAARKKQQLRIAAA